MKLSSKLILFICTLSLNQTAISADAIPANLILFPSNSPCNAYLHYDPYGLEKGFVLKEDLSHNLKVSADKTVLKGNPRISGGLNFRETEAKGIFGVAQPTEEGYVNVIHEVRKRHPEYKKIVWINLREEPVLMIDGTPYGARKVGVYTENVVSGVIGRQKITEYESHILKPVRKNIERNDSIFTFLTEDVSAANGNIDQLASLKTITIKKPSEMKTLMQTLDELNAKWNNSGVNFFRVPISDMDAPTANDLEVLRSIFNKYKNNFNETGFVMNCQFGHGRTTTGDVLFEIMRETTIHPVPAGDALKTFEIPEALRKVEALLPNGDIASSLANRAIDLSDTVLNIRENAIEKLSELTEATATSELEKAILRSNATKSVRRYYTMISFQAYLLDPVSKTQNYEKWISQRPELKKLIANPVPL